VYPELEEDFTKRQERLDDQYAKYRADVDNEVEQRIEAAVQRQRQDFFEEVDDDLRDLRAERTDWQGRAEAAEGMLVDLFRQLCGGTDRKVYLRSGGRGIEALDKGAVNAILARHGQQLRSRQTYSERLVRVRLNAQRAEGHTLFWLSTTTPAGVVEAPDGDEPAGEPESGAGAAHAGPARDEPPST
jgi:hypothetical protein